MHKINNMSADSSMNYWQPFKVSAQINKNKTKKTTLPCGTKTKIKMTMGDLADSTTTMEEVQAATQEEEATANAGHYHGIQRIM